MPRLADLAPVRRVDGSYHFGRVMPLARLAAILGFLATRWLGPDATTIGYLALAAWALLGPRQTLQALALSWLGCTLNLDVFPVESFKVATTLKWAVLATAASRTAFAAIHRRQPVPRLALYLCVFCAGAAFTSLAASPLPAISLLKLLAFLAGSTTILLAFMQAGDDRALADWATVFVLVVVAGSAMLLGSSDGYKHIFRGPTLLKGLLIRPQELAVFLAPLIAYLTSLLVSGQSSWRSNAFLCVTLLLLVTSGSRTGFLAALGACLLCGVIALAFRRDWRVEIMQVVRHPAFVGGAVLIALAVLARWDTVSERAVNLVYKRAGSIAQEFEASRGFLVRKQIANFRESPVVGIGFGMPSSPLELKTVKEGILGVPVSAPIEKGVLPMAILEETGLLGALLFLGVLGSILATAILRLGFPGASLAIAVMLNNLGEANVFSIGGMGMYYWLALGFAIYGPSRWRAGLPPRAA